MEKETNITLTLHPVKMKQKTIGLALGGGGARGCAHIGVIRALQEAGIHIDAVAGTSIGALVGAFFASGQMETLQNQLKKDHWKDILGYFDPAFSRQGLFKGNKIEILLRQILPHTTIQKLPLPYTAVATDLETGQEAWLQSGDLAQAVRASIAIPLIFTPIKKGKQLLADGGIVNPLPVNVLKAAGLELVIGVDLNHHFIQERLKYNRHQRRLQKKGIAKPPRDRFGWIDIAESSLFIMQSRTTETNLHLHAPDILIRPELNYAHLFDFTRANELIEEGYRVTQKQLPQIKRLLNENN